jgi:Cu(I)/Ag(I) efflux system protein CusF
MNIFTHCLVASAFAVGSLLSMNSFAQATMEHDHNHSSAPSTASLTEGEVKKVNLESSKVTIKHGEIRHLDMPGMTMAFTVRDKGLLDTVKAGDKIKFMAVSEGGKLFVTAIQPLR